MVTVESKRDWRAPENRRDAFLRFYRLHLRYRAHPGLVYSFLPAIVAERQLTDPEKRWLVWLNGNTQNPITTWILMQVSQSAEGWEEVVEFQSENFKHLQWDTDRRYHKSKFGEATRRWIDGGGADTPWPTGGWDEAWAYATSWYSMGRLSAWSMLEFARIVFGRDIPDAPNMLLRDSGSGSHRNGLALVSGAPIEAAYWKQEHYSPASYVDLELLAEELLEEVGYHPDVSRLTLESALCTYKSWHKPRRRYAGVYADMAYERILWAEARWPDIDFGPFWRARERDLPWYWRLESTAGDAGLSSVKQNHYLETGEPVMMSWDYPDMANSYDLHIHRKEPRHD